MEACSDAEGFARGDSVILIYALNQIAYDVGIDSEVDFEYIEARMYKYGLTLPFGKNTAPEKEHTMESLEFEVIKTMEIRRFPQVVKETVIESLQKSQGHDKIILAILGAVKNSASPFEVLSSIRNLGK